MVVNTTPDTIPKPVGTDAVAPLQDKFANQADAIQTALLKRDILHYTTSASFPAASTVPWRFVIDETSRWVYISNGTKYFAAFPMTNNPIDGTTTAAAALAERRQMLLDEWVQSGDPGQSEGRIWDKTP